jgi:hypothetical protein
MTQQEITQAGNALIAIAQALPPSELQYFYDHLEAESRHICGNENMPLGWVAEKILEISRNAGHLIVDEMAGPEHQPA